MASSISTSNHSICVFIQNIINLRAFSCRLLVLIIAAVQPFPVIANASFQFKRIYTDEGLPGNYIDQTFQDREGYIWIVTTQGVARYDGYNFRVFKHAASIENSIADSWVEAGYQDKAGRIWFATKSGLSLLDTKSGTFKTYRSDEEDESTLDDSYVLALFEDSLGQLWVGTDSGLNLYIESADEFQRIKLATQLRANNDPYYSYVSAVLEAITDVCGLELVTGCIC